MLRAVFLFYKTAMCMNYYSYFQKLLSTPASDESVTQSDVDMTKHIQRFHHGVMPEEGHCKYLDERVGGSEEKESESEIRKQDSVSPTHTEVNKHDLAMTPDECRKMIRRAYSVGDIKGYYGYKTPDEWFENEGPNGVAEIVDNYRELYDQFVDPIADDIDSIQEVLESYQKGTLVGPKNESPSNHSGGRRKVDTKNVEGIDDHRFYSSTKSDAEKSDWEMACRPTRGKDKDAVEAARARVLFAANKPGACEKFGVTQKEMNAKLRAWSAYPVSAMRLSNSLNEGVGAGAVWSGIENMSGLSQYMARKEDVASLVKSIEGDPEQFQRNYIARTMLAIDTHTDYSGLKFVFGRDDLPELKRDICNGVYSPSTMTITCRPYLQDTVAHEMGHYLDDKWGRDLGYSDYLSMDPRRHTSEAYQNKDPDVNAFIDHYNSFIQSLDEVADERSGYTLDKKEIFARFVSKFVQWTEEKARGANRIFRTEDHYHDRFGGRHFTEFVKILQEKAALDIKMGSQK